LRSISIIPMGDVKVRVNDEGLSKRIERLQNQIEEDSGFRPSKSEIAAKAIKNYYKEERRLKEKEEET